MDKSKHPVSDDETLKLFTDHAAASTSSEHITMDASDMNLHENVLNNDNRTRIESFYNEFMLNAEFERANTYIGELSFLYQSFKKLLGKESKLHNALETMRVRYEELGMKYEQAVKLAQVDRQTINHLKQQVETAWKSEALAVQKEKRTRETVIGMKLEVANLSKLVEQGVGLTMGQEYNIHEILSDNERLNDKITKLNDDIKILQKEIDELRSFKNQRDLIHEQAKKDIEKLTQDLSKKNLEIHQEIRKTERVKHDLIKVQQQLETKESVIVMLNESLTLSQSEIVKDLEKLKDLQQQIERLNKDSDANKNRLSRLQFENDNFLVRNEQLTNELRFRADDMRSKDLVITKLQFEIGQTEKTVHSLECRLRMNDEQSRQIAEDKLKLHSDIHKLKAQLETCNQERLIEKKQIQSMERIREQFHKNICKLNQQSEKQIDSIKDYQKQVKEAKAQNIQLKAEINELKSRTSQTERDKNNQLKEINNLQQRIVHIIDELKLKETQINDADKRLRDSDVKLKQTQTLYENVRNDRNVNAKNLIELQEEIDMLKKELAIFKNQNDNLRNSKVSLEAEIVRLKHEIDKRDKTHEHFVVEMDKLKKQCRASQQIIDGLNREQKNLLNIIVASDANAKNLSKKLDDLSDERCVLGSQIVRRNDEISLLYEKIRLLEHIIQRGESLYAERVANINLLRNEIKRLRGLNSSCSKAKSLVTNLKNELCLAEQELLDEKMKRYALEDTNIKQNLHRWRMLSGRDPANYELIVKMQQLQKRLILKYDECGILHLKIVEKDELYVKLKQALARRLNGSGDAEKEFKEKEQALKVKTRKLKSAIAERNMLERINEEFQKAVECKDNEINYFKQRFSKMTRDQFECYF